MCTYVNLSVSQKFESLNLLFISVRLLLKRVAIIVQMEIDVGR